MTEIGQGSKAAIEKTIASMGAYKLIIFPWAANNAGVNQGAGTVQTLKPADVDEIARQCPAVAVVVPMVWARAQVVYGRRNWVPQQMTGDRAGLPGHARLGGPGRRHLFHRRRRPLEQPRLPDRGHGKARIVRRRIAHRQNDPHPQRPLPGHRAFEPAGREHDGPGPGRLVIAPWTTIKFRVNSHGAGSTKLAAAAAAATINTLNNPYVASTPLYPQALLTELTDTPQPVRQTSIDFIQAKAAGAEQVPAAIDQIEALLRERHHLAEGADDDFKILDLTEIAHAAARASELMGTLLLVVAAISLVVGGVGIMNIMLVSVTERTREIGLRMAVGARRHHILRQFLVEAVLLCLAGGVLGILAGRGASILVREFEHWATGVSVPAIVISVLVAAGVGIVFGFYPAWKASRLDPIEALRHE